VPVSGSIFTLLVSGTCFMGTMIFTKNLQLMAPFLQPAWV